MMRARSIAVAQTCPVKGDVPANLAEHVRLAHLAAGQGAQIAVFPEMSLTGYELGLADALAFSEDDSRLAPLVHAASANSITLIVGAPIRIGPRLHIGAFIVAPDGTIALYTKQHLGVFSGSAVCDGAVPSAEDSVFQPGDRNPLIRFGGNIGAAAVCADIGRPSHAQHAADRGARNYLASMFVIPSEFERDAARLRAHAMQHSMTVAMANFGSASGGLASAGRSAIWSETGELLARLASIGAGVAVVAETERGWCAGIRMLAHPIER